MYIRIICMYLFINLVKLYNNSIILYYYSTTQSHYNIHTTIILLYDYCRGKRVIRRGGRHSCSLLSGKTGGQGDFGLRGVSRGLIVSVPGKPHSDKPVVGLDGCGSSARVHFSNSPRTAERHRRRVVYDIHSATPQSSRPSIDRGPEGVHPPSTTSACEFPPRAGSSAPPSPSHPLNYHDTLRPPRRRADTTDRPAERHTYPTPAPPTTHTARSTARFPDEHVRR